MVDDDEARARETLAAAHRIAAHDGLSEGTWNHFSVMVDARRMLITPADTHWSLVDAESLAIVGDDVQARERGVQFEIGYRIHRALHDARRDARCVLHAHPPYATALSLLDDNELLAASQMSVHFHGRVAYNDRYDLLDGPDVQGETVAAALGDRSVLFLRGHGVVVAAATVEIAYMDLYMLELACRSQILATSTGRPLRTFTAAEAAELAPSGPDQSDARRHFDAMRALIETPVYR